MTSERRRVALVTGASSGLGQGIALALGRAGWGMGLLARRRDRLQGLAAEIERAGGQPHLLPGDLRDPAVPARALEELQARAGRLDLLVNNAGIATATQPEVATDAQFDEVFALNVRALYRLSHLALPLL